MYFEDVWKLTPLTSPFLLCVFGEVRCGYLANPNIPRQTDNLRWAAISNFTRNVDRMHQYLELDSSPLPE